MSVGLVVGGVGHCGGSGGGRGRSVEDLCGGGTMSHRFPAAICRGTKCAVTKMKSSLQLQCFVRFARAISRSYHHHCSSSRSKNTIKEARSSHIATLGGISLDMRAHNTNTLDRMFHMCLF